MAELDDKLLKNLDKTLESMNERLLTLETTLSGVKNGINKTFDPSIITSFSDAIRGLKTLRLIDAEGATKDIQKVKDKIDELEAKWKGDKPLGKGESFAGIADELARYKALMKDIQKGSEQRAVELANAAKKEADAVEAEERRKQREFQATANEQAKLLKAYSDIQQARSVVTGGKKFGELDAEQTKKYKEFGRTLDELKKKMDDLEKMSPGSKAAGTQIFKEEEAVTKAKREAAEEQTRIKKEQAEQERQINEAIKEEERRRAAESKRMLEEEKKALADYIRLYSEKMGLLKTVAPIDAKFIATGGDLSEQEKNTRGASWKRIEEINAEMDKLRSNYVSVLEYEEKIKANGKDNVEWSKVRLTQEQALANEKERQAKSESKQQSDEAKIQRQADAIVKKRIDLEAKVQRIDNDRAIRQQTNSKISQQALDAENVKYLALLQRIDQLDKALAKLEGKQSGVTAKAEKRNMPYENYVTAVEDERKAKAIENSTKKLKEQKNTLDSMLPTLQRLASAFGVAFSVRSLAQFGKKLIETRGEFEMQFVAMKQIIGDVDAATKIWNQTMQQALQSPKTFKELVTYTKQLAAYRIETEKLFDTTKRLADVSAGLGVDMGRLILAYGQVKSANFLRASEIRQFTEAGVNIVGNLAKYFSELENRAVSTSDVMERVTKRMVMFSDVEEIFRRMTDEGGEFFNMQEVQADTVKGQIMKLRDAYDQMLNTIGEQNQGTIRDLVDAINELVRNWRDVANFIKLNAVVLLPLIAAMRLMKTETYKNIAANTTFIGTMKQLGGSIKYGVMSISGIVKELRNIKPAAMAGAAGMKLLDTATKLTVASITLLKGALKSFAPFLIIEGVLWLVNKLGEADRATKELSRTLDEVETRNVGNLQKEIDGFTDLVERLKKATKGSHEYLEIRNKIQSQYGAYLDNLDAEAITVENLANAYDRVVERMREKTRQHIMEEGVNEIAKSYSAAMLEFTKEISNTQFAGITISSKEAQEIAKKMYDIYSKNPLPEYSQKNKLFFEAFKQYYGKDISSYATTGYDYAVKFQDAIISRYEKQIELETKANSLTRATANTHQEYLDQLALEEEHQENINKIQQKVQSKEKTEYELQLEKIRYDEKRLELQAKYEKKSSEWLDKEKKKLKENYDAFLKSYNARVEAYVGSVYGKNWREVDNEKAFMDYNAMVATQSRIAQGQSRWEESILNDKKVTEENIKRLKEEQATQTAKDAEASKHLNDELTKENHRLAIIKKQMELLGLHEKDKSKGSGSANNSIYGDRIRLLQDMLQKYRQAAKEAYGFAKAEEKTGQSFEDAWNSIMPAGYGELEVPTSYAALAEMLQRLEAFTPQFDKNGKLSKMMADLKKAVSDALSQVDIELSVRIREDFGKQIEKMFSDYELTLDFESIGLPSDLAKNLFGVDTSSLDEISSYLQKFATEHAEDWNDEINKVYTDSLKKIGDKEQEMFKKSISNLFKRVKNSADEMKTVMAQAAADINFADMLFDKQEAQKNIDTITEQIEKNIEEINRLTPADGKATGVAAQQIARLEAENKILQNRVLRLSQMYGNLSAEQYTDLVRATMEHENEQLQKISLEQLKQLPEYIEAMGRTAGWSNEKLREMLDYLQNLISVSGGNIDITEYKSIINQIDKIQAEIKHNDYPFGREGFAKVAQMLQEQAEAEAKLNELTEERNQLVSEQKLLELEEIELQARLNELKAKGLDENSTEIQEIMDDIKSNQKFKTSNLNAQKKNAAGIQTITKGNAQTMAIIDAIIHGINNLVQEIYQNLKKVEILLQDYEVDTEHGKWAKWSKGMETFAKASQDATNGWEAYKKGDIAGIVYEVINGITDIWHGINEMVSQKHVDTIYEMEQELERLTVDYEKLQKAIEKTWDTSSYMMNYDKMVKNLEDQRKALQAQYDAEDARKNSDEEKMKEYQNSIRDIDETLTELKQKQIEVFGGLGEVNYRSAAQEFVDSWKEAFLETGDGLQGLQDHFDEFLNEWFVKQATMRIAGRMLAPLFEDIDKAVDESSLGGTSVLLSELQRVREKFATIAPQLSDSLEQLAGMWGLGEGEGGLSGLAAGIQGMTEEQANILEAYWNSVRGYTASIDMNVSRIADMLGAGSADLSNPMLQSLRNIEVNTAYIRSIYDLLDGTTRNLGQGRGFISYQM